MSHLSRDTFTGMHDDGRFKMPAILHTTFCGKTVTGSEVVAEPDVDCETCLIARGWEEIDNLPE